MEYTIFTNHVSKKYVLQSTSRCTGKDFVKLAPRQGKFNQSIRSAVYYVGRHFRHVFLQVFIYLSSSSPPFPLLHNLHPFNLPVDGLLLSSLSLGF